MIRQVLRELEQHFAGLLHFEERWDWLVWFVQQIDTRMEKLMLAEAVVAGGRLSAAAHLHYLPAAHAYRAFLMSSAGHMTSRSVAHSLRGRLGESTRRLYVAQRPVFDLSMKILLSTGAVVVAGVCGVSGPLSVAAVEAFLMTPAGKACLQRLWDRFKHAEALRLAEARQITR